MTCNKCDKDVNQEEIEHFDSLPAMTGYNYIPDNARCIVCKKPVCKGCMAGLGAFMFVCKEGCKQVIEQRISSK